LATLLGQEYLNYLHFVHLILVSALSRVQLILPCLPFSLRSPIFAERGPVKNRNSAIGKIAIFPGLLADKVAVDKQ
jgi:hypothetical protein